MSLALVVKGPVIARLCARHYNQVMEAPKAGSETLVQGMESLVAVLKKAAHGMRGEASG